MKIIFLKITSKLNRYLCFTSGIMLVLLMLVGTFDVVCRYLFDSPLKGALNISEIILVGVVFFSWAYNQEEEGNVKVELFYNKFSQKNKHICNIICSIISFLCFVLMTWQSVLAAIESKESCEIIDVINIPAYPIKFIVTLGVGVLCLQIMVKLLNNLSSLKEI